VIGEIVNISDTRRSVTYGFSSDEVAAVRESEIDKLCKQVKVSGFRPGKVPRSVILVKFADVLRGRLNSSIIDMAINRLNSEHGDWRIVSIIDAKREDAEENVICTLTVDVIPDFELPNYEDVSIVPIVVSVLEEEVDAEIRDILRGHAKYEVVDREAKNGDFVKLNYVGKFADGESVEESGGIPPIYGSQTNTWEEAGSRSAPGVRAIVDGVVGVKAGDKKTVSQGFGDDFEVSALAGKTIFYDLEIIEVRECTLPELSEDLLKTIGAGSEDDLREKIRASILDRKTSQERLRQREELTAKLLDAADIKVPESSVDSEAAALMNDFADSQVRSGTNPSEVKEHSQEIFDIFKPIATTRVKLGIILDGVAKREKIEISTEDVENVLWHDIRTKKIDTGKYVAELKRNSSKIVDLRRRALRSKALDHLMTIACKDTATTEQPLAAGGEERSS
jgi:trigger factor